MWLMVLALLFGSALYQLGRTIVAFAATYRAAKKTGLPIIISLVSARNPVWLIIQKKVAPLLQSLPFGLGGWVKYTIRGWLWADQDKMVQELGKSWAMVSPRGLDLYSADPDVISQVYAKRKDFDRNAAVRTSIPTLLQGSVSSVAGADWQRQRRIAAPPFNENNMSLVWDESLRQAMALCEWWKTNDKGFTTSCIDTMTVALNILATAGLGTSWEFTPPTTEHGKSQDSSEILSADYRDTMSILLSSMSMLSLTPEWLYRLDSKYVRWLPLPKALREHVIAAEHFWTLMQHMVAERRDEFRNGKVNDNILLNAMIAQSEAAVTENGLGMTDKELFGNMFGYSVAGHETTAHTLNYTLHILVAYPEWQDWIQTEVDQVYADVSKDMADIDYTEYFPRLKRCLALMYETLRLYPPVLEHQKQTLGPDNKTLLVEGREIVLPPDSVVHLNAISSHVMSEYWGPDHRKYNPSRWIKSSQDCEEFVQPTEHKEAYFPWSLGGRNCPGRKFSQVEFVAVISYMLKNFRVEAVPLEGETMEAMRWRVWEVTRDSEPQVTMNMRKPETVCLRLVSRANTKAG